MLPRRAGRPSTMARRSGNEEGRHGACGHRTPSKRPTEMPMELKAVILNCTLKKSPAVRHRGSRAASWLSIDSEQLTVVAEGSLQHRVEVHNVRVTGVRVAEQRPGLTGRHAQGTARIRRCRGKAGFVLGPRRYGVEDAKRPVSLAGLDEKQGQGAAQTVDAHVSHAATEDERLLEDRARARFVAGGERHARETAKCYGAGPGRGASARQRGGIGEQAPRTGEISAHELDARADRERIGHGLFVVSAPPDACELVCVALRLVDGAAVEVSVADRHQRPVLDGGLARVAREHQCTIEDREGHAAGSWA